MAPLPLLPVTGNVSKEERGFWGQPDGEGYKPYLHFSLKYRKASARIAKERRLFLVVVASGGTEPSEESDCLCCCYCKKS